MIVLSPFTTVLSLFGPLNSEFSSVLPSWDPGEDGALFYRDKFACVNDRVQKRIVFVSDRDLIKERELEIESK